MKKILKISANLLTISRIILVFFMLPWIFFVNVNKDNYQDKYHFVFIVVFVIASITDALDGYISRKIMKQTIFGKFFDPIADKLLIIVSFFYIYILARNKHLLPLSNAYNKEIESFVLIFLLIMIIRDFLIMGVRLIAFEKKTIITASSLGKIKTICIFISIFINLLARLIENICVGFSFELKQMIIFFLIINSILIILSGLNYIIKNFKLIEKNFY